jgi:hypothetical protein
MRDSVEFARDSGVNLGFFGANTSYTQIRLESSSAGVPNRVVVEYRDYPWAHTDPVQGPTTTGDFRWLGRPEQTMVGVQFSFSSPNVDYVVTNSSHWVYAGTGFHDGDHVAGIVGYEADVHVQPWRRLHESDIAGPVATRIQAALALPQLLDLQPPAAPAVHHLLLGARRRTPSSAISRWTRGSSRWPRTSSTCSRILSRRLRQ